VPNVHITGKLPVEEGKLLVQKAGVYLCTTRETFGIGTLEAMACEVPVLGWRWGGQVEIVQHKVHGYLAQPGDYDDLLVGLRYCLEHRERLGKEARRHVMQHFTWPHMIQQYAELYRGLVRKHANRAKQPKVSVVITCHNLANVLPRAVDSVLAQEQWEQDETEIVIVNDASPDDTADVATELAAKHSNIKIVTNSSNLYLAGALNAGIASSRGRYIVPLDADNELGTRALRALGDALDSDRAIDIAYGAMQVIDEAGVNAPFVSGWPGEFNFTAQMQHKNQIPSTSMYRREVWERTGGYRRRCRTAEDADFWCRATSFGAVPARVTDAVTLIYHDRSDSMSHREKDWDWTAWYSWSRDLKRAPFGAAIDASIRPQVSSYQPSLVTVVIPVGPGHNELLIDAIDSLMSQTYENWHCIVVNDSGAPLPWLPSFVKVLNTGGNKGPAAARNMALTECVTPLFIPLDADDYLHPDALDVLIRCWHPGALEYLYTDWIIGETLERKNMPEFSCDQLRKQLLHSGTAMYPLDMWRSAGGYDEQLDSWEDWDFVLAGVKAGYCGVHVPHALFYYRMAAGQRREALFARKQQSADAIKAKWPELADRELPMGCGCQSTRVTRGAIQPSVPASNGNGQSSAQTASDDLVLVEYVAASGPRTYKGASGVEYRFGPDEGRRMRYVRSMDLSTFDNRPKEFRIKRGSDAIVVSDIELVAAGPPSK
jgi:glycosyltransferase involved in cell wall biosynthesis